jgi:hypothetical protein
MKRIVLALVATAVSGPAWSQCSSLPYTLTNGTVANADQVMADINCASQGVGIVTGTSPNAGSTGGVRVRDAAGDPDTAYLQFTNNAISSQYGWIKGLKNTGIQIYPSLDVAGYGRFMSGNAGTSGAVIIRDAVGDPDAAILQFVNNNNTDQYGYIKAMKAHGFYASDRLAIAGINNSYTLFVNGSAAGLSGYANLSDGRLKSNITQIDGALATVMQLRGVRYTWKAASERTLAQKMNLAVAQPQVGFIAQEVAKVIPEAVNLPQSADDPYSLKPTDIIPFLVEAIKAQQSEIAILQEKVMHLEAQK